MNFYYDALTTIILPVPLVDDTVWSCQFASSMHFITLEFSLV